MDNKKTDLTSIILHDKKIRTTLTKESHEWFFGIYLSHYITHKAAPFHKEIFSLSEDNSINNLVIVAFRGSAKSTIMTLSYPIWSILGKQQKKFIIIVGQTQRQAKQLLANIKIELETNELLKKDLGPFEEQTDEWGSSSLVLPWYDARITTVSMEQTIRGMRHKQYRPDLIICDDIEDLQSVKTKEGRDKVYNWITGEVVPAGDKNTKIIFIGNLLHEDSLLMRMKEKINNNTLDGIFKAIPLIDKQGNINWPGKFPNQEEIDLEKKKLGNNIAWEREYELRIIPDEGQIVHPEWIQRYESLDSDFRYTATGVDPAISKSSSADYTAAVSARICGYGESLKIYILPNPLNQRLNFPETVQMLKQITVKLKSELYVESVAYQRSLPEQLQHENIPAEGVAIQGQDKRARLVVITHFIQSGKILFPKHGAEELITQLLGFGIEKHDDLVDAFTLLIGKILEDDQKPQVFEIFTV